MRERLLDERFDGADLSPVLAWYCQPSGWRIESGRLVIEPDAKTDYWQKTHYGFSVDNGPFLHAQVDGDFVVTTRVHLYPQHQYDQAGLMVRIDAEHWIKTSVEYEIGEPSKLGAVVTNGGYSDWSTQDFPDGVSEVSFRICRTGDDYIVESMLHAGDVAGDAQGRWVQIRMAHLHNVNHVPVQCGLYACCPIDAGFRAEYDYLKIEVGGAEE